MPDSTVTFLEEDPTVAHLLQAVVANHRQFMIHGARRAGGAVRRENGAICADTPGADGGVEILFPRLGRATASETLDRIMQYCRDRRPLRSVSCWSLLPPRPPDLGARLVARGFEWGWQPHWMWLDFRKMRVEHSPPPGLRIELAEEDAVWDVEDLPNYHREAADRRRNASGGRRPGTHKAGGWHFAAWMEGKVVGHCSVFVTTGRLGVAGIYDCGVVPAARNRGIGRAVTLAACRQGLSLGCRHALLNATGMGEPVYRRIGFGSIGFGQTWWLHRKTIEAQPPSETEVTFAEAVGRGDGAALDALSRRLQFEQLDAPLTSGMTPMELAVQTRQPASAQWLARHGATLDVISAWDLGWKERVPHMLAASPELANRRVGDWQLTPLHVAVERGDVELARVLLAANPDLEIADTQFHSTPLGWARHFQRPEIIELIQQHQTRRND